MRAEIARLHTEERELLLSNLAAKQQLLTNSSFVTPALLARIQQQVQAAPSSN